MRSLWIAVARRVEGWLERIGRSGDAAAPVLDPYIGYAVPGGWVLRAAWSATRKSCRAGNSSA